MTDTKTDPWTQWDLPETENPQEFDSTYVRWTDPGQKVAGILEKIDTGTDFNGGECPRVRIQPSEGPAWLINVAQARLKFRFLEARPQVGEFVTVTYTGDEKLDNGRSVKNFTIETRAATVEDEKPF